MYLSTLSPPQPQASHSEFLNISGERLPGSDRVEASHNLQALWFFLLLLRCRRFYILLIRQIMKNPLARKNHAEQFHCSLPLPRLQFHSRSQCQAAHPPFPPSRLHQLSNSLSSTWLFSNLFNLCKMAISAANLFKLVASSVPFYFLFCSLLGSVQFSVPFYSESVLHSRVMKIKTSYGIFICQLGGFESFSCQQRERDGERDRERVLALNWLKGYIAFILNFNRK